MCGKHAGARSIGELHALRLKDFAEELRAVSPGGATESPKYDPTRPYVPRSRRREWIPVGMIGKMYARDNGECRVGRQCDRVNGIAVPGTSWYVLERVEPDVIRILYR